MANPFVKKKSSGNPFIKPKEEGVEWTDYVTGIPEILLSGVTQFAGSAPATIGGMGAEIGSLVTGQGDPKEAFLHVYDETLDALTYEPRGEGARKVLQQLQPVAEGIQKGEQFLKDVGGDIGGPEGSAFAVTLPHAILEFVGAGLIKRGVNLRDVKTVERVSKNMMDEGLMDEAGNLTVKGQEVIKSHSPEFKTELEATAEPQDIKEAALAAQGESQAAEIAQIDQSIMKAAEDLGVDMPVASASQNRAFVEAAQAAKSQPDSILSMQEARAIGQTVEAVDDYIARLRNGSLDVSGVDQAMIDIFNRNIDDLSLAAEKGYGIVDRAIPKTSQIDSVDIIRNYVDDALAEVGGDIKELRPIEKRLLSIVRKFDDGEFPVTYGLLDKVRKEIGKGYKRKGQFADEDSAALDAVYSTLSKQQKDFLNKTSPELLEAYEAAASNAAKYKGLQTTMQQVFGKTLSKSVIPQIKGVVSNLRKGNIRPYQQLMDNVPKEFRGEIAALALKEMFELGARTNVGLSEGFVKTWQSLNRNKDAKRILLKDLPPETAKFIDDVGRVWTGLIRSKSLENTSKTARDILTALDNGSALKKIMGIGGMAASEAIIPSGLGTAGAITGAATMLAKRGKNTAQRIDTFITSNAFSRAIKLAANGKTNVAHDILNKSYAYKKWLRTLPKSEQMKIKAMGFIPWITTPIGAGVMIAGGQDGN